MVQDDALQRYINEGVKEVRKSDQDVVLHLPSDTSINGGNFLILKWSRKRGRWYGEHRYTTWYSTYPAESHGPFYHELGTSDEIFILKAYGIKERNFLPGTVLGLSPSRLEKIASEQEDF